MTGTLIYDGNCGICQDSVRWARAHLRPGEDVTFVANQEIADLDAYGLTRQDVDAAAWWVDPDGTAFGGHEAAAKTLEHCNGAWPAVGRSLTVWPLRFGARAAYRWIADNRHRFRRHGNVCPTPQD